MSRGASPRPASGRGRIYLVGAGSLVAAASTYVVNLLAARTLPIAETTTFLTNLGVLFFCYGVVVGVTTEFTRSIAASAASGVADGPQAWRVAGWVAALAAVVVAVTYPLWQHSPGVVISPALMVVVALGVASYALHSASCGVLGGSQQWGLMSALVGTEGLARVVFVVAVALAAVASGDNYLVAVVAAAVSWVGFVLFSPRVRAALQLRLDVPLPVLVGKLGSAFVSQAATVALTVSFPVLLAGSTPAAEYAASAPLLLAVALTRAPLMIPLMAYQSMLVAHFVTARGSAVAAVLRLAALVFGVGVVGAVLAWWIGPTLMVWLVSPQYFVDGPVLGGLTLAAAAIALLTLTGSLTQATSLHRWYVSGWVVAVLVSVGLLFVPGDMALRSMWSLLGGPLAGVVVHVVGVLRRPRPVQ